MEQGIGVKHESQIMKKGYLAVYDNGMGGVWVVIHAITKEDITNKFPELKVIEFENRPEWMTNERYMELYERGYSLWISTRNPLAGLPG